MEGSADIANQIIKLADLHAQGILTDEEFSRLKTRLLMPNDQRGAAPAAPSAEVANTNSSQSTPKEKGFSLTAVTSILYPLLLVGGVIIAVAVVVGLASSPSSKTTPVLEVNTLANGVQIINKGPGVVTLTKITLNERDGCDFPLPLPTSDFEKKLREGLAKQNRESGGLLDALGGSELTRENTHVLKVGDTFTFGVPFGKNCGRIVKISVSTDRGVFSFGS